MAALRSTGNKLRCHCGAAVHISLAVNRLNQGRVDTSDAIEILESELDVKVFIGNTAFQEFRPFVIRNSICFCANPVP